MLVFGLDSSNKQRMWLHEIVWALSCDFPLSFWRWRYIGMKPAKALMPKEGNV